MPAQTEQPPRGTSLNESPSEKEGKFFLFLFRLWRGLALNESPSEKEGKSEAGFMADRLHPLPQ